MGRYQIWGFSFFLGSFCLCFLSVFQKLIAGYPLYFRGFFMPFLAGGIFGLLIGMRHYRLNEAKTILRKAYDGIEHQVEKRTTELTKTNAQLNVEIDKRKQAEKQLQLEHSRLMNILEAIPDGVYIVDQHFNIQYINPVIKKNFGAIQGRKCYKYFHDRKEVCPWCKNKEVFAGRSVNWEWYSSKNDKYFELFDTPFKNPDGSISKFEIFHDITDRKQAEKALIKAYNIINRSPAIAFLWKNLEGWPVEVVSDNVKSLFGYGVDEFKSGQVFYSKIVHPDDLERVAEEVSTFSNEKGRINFVHKPYRIITKDGKVKWVDDRTFIRRDNQGNITHYEGIVVDCTKREQIFRALQENEEKYRSMMEVMKDLVYICSSDYQVKYMNPAMIKRIGRDATGEHCFKALHDLTEICPWCQHNKAQQNEYVDSEIVSPKDNRSYHVSHASIVQENGSTSKMTIYRDITDFKEMELQLQQVQKMESIGTLAGGIAHDFNNILFPIIGYTEMLLEDFPEKSPLQNSLNKIYAGSLRAKDLVQQILTFARQENSEAQRMKVQPIIKEALKLIRSTIPTTIDMKQDIHPGCGIVKADPTQIHQIIMNLATNASHAMEKTGGELKINLKEVELDKYDLVNPDMEPGAYVCLTVADTGKGMDKDLIQKIFDPFFTTKKKGRGTGMGLSVVHGIVTGMGGAINVYSKPGIGTQFNVYLPVMEESISTRQATGIKTPRQGGSEQILLVDDEEAIITMEKLMLERLGYQVTCRTSSIDAFKVFRDNPDKFDIIITDMAMPDMPGDKLSAELIKIRPDIPVLLCTGFSETISKEKSASIGIKGFLLKPIVMKDLAEKIREVLEENKN